MAPNRMNREGFFAKLALLDAEQRGKILWNLISSQPPSPMSQTAGAVSSRVVKIDTQREGNGHAGVRGRRSRAIGRRLVGLLEQLGADGAATAVGLQVAASAVGSAALPSAVGLAVGAFGGWAVGPSLLTLGPAMCAVYWAALR
jgi:hypothetical protein